MAAAAAADVVIAVVGDTDAAYGRGTCAEGIDADTLDLPGCLFTSVGGRVDALPRIFDANAHNVAVCASRVFCRKDGALTRERVLPTAGSSPCSTRWLRLVFQWCAPALVLIFNGYRRPFNTFVPPVPIL